jgi:hypothetical protein
MRAYRGQLLKGQQNQIFAEKNGWKEQGLLTEVED